MRRHAKASTAGSTQRQATGLGRIFRGAFSSSTLAVMGLVVLSLAAVLFSATPAFAGTATDRPLLFSFNGSDTAAGAFTNVRALEIDQAGGTVYVIDQGHNVLDKFNLAGVAQTFSATGSSSLNPGFSFNELSDVAVDNSAVNPGRIHVMREYGPVNAFSPAGASLWELGGFSDVCGLAVDTAGNLWVGDWSNAKARKYAPTGSPPAEIGSIAVTSGRPCRLDVEASGNVYINRYFGGVDKYEGGVKGATIDPETSFGVTVDQSSASGHVFTLHGSSFNEFDSAGVLEGTFGTGTIGSGKGIAYSAALDRVYVADGTSNTVKVFGPKATGTVPDLTIEATTEIGISKAKFSGKINPQSVPNSYFFEWKEGTGASWAAAKSTAAQSIEPTDSAEHAVSFDATGLPGNKTLQVRLVGTNTGNGLRAVSGPDTFTTAQAASAPVVTIATPSPVTATTAKVTGTVNPKEDFGTSWQVRVSTDPACASDFEELTLHNLESEAASPVAVSEEISGLLPNQHYCVKITATNSFGTTTSETKEFTTLAIPPDQVITAFAAPRTDTTARLNGRVNPQGSDLTYHFEYSADGGTTWTVLPDQQDTSGAREQLLVAHELTGLQPDTTYQYRLFAENAAGLASPQGGTLAFKTRTTEEVTPPVRGIELVNNPDKGNQNVSPIGMAPDGNRALWSVAGGAPGGYNGFSATFLAKRTPTGWRSESVVPPPDRQVTSGGFGLAYLFDAATPDFTDFIFEVVGVDPLVDAGLAGISLVRLDDAQSQDVLKSYSPDESGRIPFSDHEVTDDGSHVLVIDPVTRQLEDIGGGTPETISLMPGGAPSACGLDREGASFNAMGVGGSSAAQANMRPGYRRISVIDASRVYFETRPDGDCSGYYGLYVRNRMTEETTLIDPGTGEDVEMVRATPDGRRAVFVTRSALDGADTNTSRDVYLWKEEAGGSTCLTCVVPAASVYRDVMVSDDFSHVYFESSQQLVPGQGTDGDLNLYVLSGGTVRFVANPDQPEGLLRNGAFVVDQAAQLSADGNVLVFLSIQRGLTADALAPSCDIPFGSGGECQQLYRYDDRDGSLECISCRLGGETTEPVGTTSSLADGLFQISSDGSTVAFQTPQALLRLDVNNDADIYEWRGGALQLVTDGVTDFQDGQAAPSVRALDADGGNILFVLDSPGLTGFEQDGLRNLYVARIGGGFQPPSPPVHCSEDSCQGPLQAAPPPALAGSSSFAGRGNLAPTAKRCRRGALRRGRRCASKRAPRRRACRHKRGAAKRRCVNGQTRRIDRPQGKQLRQARARAGARRVK